MDHFTTSTSMPPRTTELLLPPTKFVNPRAGVDEQRYGEDPLRRIRRQAGFGQRQRPHVRSKLRYISGAPLSLTRTRHVPWVTDARVSQQGESG